MSERFSHINDSGDAHMVDVTHKAVTHRQAVATVSVLMQPETLTMIIDGSHHKGDVFAVARIAGIQAAKKCSDLIPLCHPLMLTSVKVNLEPVVARNRVDISCVCKLAGTTGVEMEALTGASVAALTLYDMCKAVDKGMVIDQLKLQEKTGGKSGNWSRND